MRKKQVPAV
jgi:hypothetical protein